MATGGYGAVYEAYDRERGGRVALKRLVRVDPTAVWRFKQEFRALADVKHPNLVRLHELFCDDGAWYLTMDLIVGVDFQSYVRTSALTRVLPTGERVREPWRFDESRLRAALAQLVSGVQALHEARRLHRDLKPSNVLVTPSGAVVILDFGLVAELQGDIYQSYEDSVKGTPIYMSPEMANDEAIGPASDWYAVGVMLYEALTGASPFTVTPFQILYHKSTREAADPRVGRPGVLPDDLVELSLSLLARAGRAAEAARAYLSAAPLAKATEALELQRKAAAQLLRSGHIDEGTEVIRTVLGALGMTLPESAAQAAQSIKAHRAEIARRGFAFVPRSASRIAPETLARMDLCWSIGNGLGGVSPVVGAEFHARHVLLAMEAGEPYRIARALAWEAILAATEGPAGTERAESLAARAEDLAEQTEHPHALGWAVAAAAVTAFCEARWRRASQLCQYGAALFRERCVDIAWEVGELEIRWNLPALHHLGQLAELERRAASAEKEAIARGDRYALTNLHTAVVPLALLARGGVSEARSVSGAAIAGWSSDGTHMQHWFDLMTQCRADLYEGLGASCLARIEQRRPALAAALLEGYQTVRFHTAHLCALGALQVAFATVTMADRRAARTLAAREGRRLVRSGHPWARALGWCLVAGVLHARGMRGGAEAAGAAVEGFASLEMPLCAAAARWMQARIEGDEARAQEALAALAKRGVHDPPRWAATVVPTL